MKQIPSRTQTLEREVEMLTLENASLKEELDRVKEMYRQSWIHGRKDINSTTQVTQMSRQMGSYLSHTIASASRRVRRASNEVAETVFSPSIKTANELQYEDGKLMVPVDLAKANFMKPTTSSLQRARSVAWYSHNAWNSSMAPSPTLSAVDSILPEDAMWACEWCESIDRNNEDQTDQSLKARSRLDDHTFFDTPASKCPVPFDFQQHLLNAALRLAQETLWTALREHWPRLQRRCYLETPVQVRFGREELSSAFGNEDVPTEANEMCGQTRRTVIGYVLNVVYLRNAVCHASRHSMQEVDSLLQYAQALAVLLRDERRSFKVRKLRDELQSKATQAYDEIETRVGIAALPYAKPWPLYLQHFFSRINVDFDLGPTSGLPEFIVQAAREWKLKYASPGELNPDYLANVSKAKSFLRVGLSGRRASLSVCQVSKPVW